MTMEITALEVSCNATT